MPILSKEPHVDIPEIPYHEVILGALWHHSLSTPNQTTIVDAYDQHTFYTCEQVFTFAHSLTTSLYKLGLGKHDVALAAIPTCIDAPIVLLATWLRGAVFSAVNPVYTPEELRRQVVDCKAKFFFCTDDNYEHVMEAIAPIHGQIRHVIVFGNSVLPHQRHGAQIHRYEDLKSAWPESFAPKVDIDVREHVCLLPYSSGTTGAPKGVMLTHYNLTAMHYIAESHNIRNVVPALFTDKGEAPSPVSVNFLPFFHIYGLMVSVGLLARGNRQIMMKRFDPTMFLQVIQDNKIPSVTVVPPIAVFLAKHPIVDKYDLSSIRAMTCGAAPLAKETELELHKRLPNLKHIGQGYGMTETSLAVAMARMTDGGPRAGSCGIIAANNEVKIVDVESGKELGANQEGEVWVRSPTIMKGYFHREADTAATIDKEGFLHTGDIGYYDEDQWLYIVDRLKELIKVKGFQVPPAELEGLLLSHPDVADCCVIGVPDAAAGELPRAYVVKKHPGLTAQQVADFVAKHVSHYKQLKGGIEFIDVIPKSQNGKILRRQLRDHYKKSQAKL